MQFGEVEKKKTIKHKNRRRRRRKKKQQLNFNSLMTDRCRTSAHLEKGQTKINHNV